MRGTGRMLAVLGIVGGLGLGAPVAVSQRDVSGTGAGLELLGRAAAAQPTITNPGLLNGVSNGGAGGTGDGGQGGNSGAGGDGGLSVVHDVGTAHAEPSIAVSVDDIMTGDVDGHAIQVDARGATRPVVVFVADSFGNTGVEIFAPGGPAQAGTTGGTSAGVDASGGASGEAGDGGNTDAPGGAGGRGPGSTTVTAPIG